VFNSGCSGLSSAGARRDLPKEAPARIAVCPFATEKTANPDRPGVRIRLPDTLREDKLAILALRTFLSKLHRAVYGNHEQFRTHRRAFDIKSMGFDSPNG
jgi:hypothetical protein